MLQASRFIDKLSTVVMRSGASVVCECLLDVRSDRARIELAAYRRMAFHDY